MQYLQNEIDNFEAQLKILNDKIEWLVDKNTELKLKIEEDKQYIAVSEMDINEAEALLNSFVENRKRLEKTNQENSALMKGKYFELVNQHKESKKKHRDVTGEHEELLKMVNDLESEKKRLMFDCVKTNLHIENIRAVVPVSL